MDPEPQAGPPGAAPAVTTRRDRATPLPQLVTELRDLVVAYVKQETIVPLKALGRYVGFGVGGSLLLGFGVVFLGMSGLRALQTETGDTFTGNWTWAPYAIMVVALAIVGALVWLLGTRRAKKGTP